MFQNSRINPRLLKVPVDSPRPKIDSPFARPSVSWQLALAKPVSPGTDVKTSFPASSSNVQAPSVSRNRSRPLAVWMETKSRLVWICVGTRAQSVFETAHDGRAENLLAEVARRRNKSGARTLSSTWPFLDCKVTDCSEARETDSEDMGR